MFISFIFFWSLLTTLCKHKQKQKQSIEIIPGINISKNKLHNYVLWELLLSELLHDITLSTWICNRLQNTLKYLENKNRLWLKIGFHKINIILHRRVFVHLVMVPGSDTELASSLLEFLERHKYFYSAINHVGTTWNSEPKPTSI